MEDYGYKAAERKRRARIAKEVLFLAKKQFKKTCRRIIVIGLVITMGVVGFGGYFCYKTVENISTQDSTVCSFNPSNGVNVLLLGTDAREEGKPARADMIMLLSVNTKNKNVELVSFQRDSYVSIPGRGPDKLAHAYAYGGADLTVQTIQENFEVEIDGYLILNLASRLYEVIDALGGAEVKLTKEETALINGYLYELNEITNSEYGTSYMEPTEGVVTLDGRQALSYVRIRYIGEDWERTSRQREVIRGMGKTLLNHIKSGNVMALLHCYQAFPKSVSAIQASMSEKELMKLMPVFIIATTYEMREHQIPQDGTWNYATTESGMSVVEIDLDTNNIYLNNLLNN